MFRKNVCHKGWVCTSQLPACGIVDETPDSGNKVLSPFSADPRAGNGVFDGEEETDPLAYLGQVERIFVFSAHGASKCKGRVGI